MIKIRTLQPKLKMDSLLAPVYSWWYSYRIRYLKNMKEKGIVWERR